MLQLLPPEFEHKDSRRTLRQLVTTDLKQVNTYQVSKGAILGEHYHKVTFEYFYILKGSFLVVLRSVGTSEKRSKVVGKEGFFCVRPFIVHTVEALTNGEFMTFLTKAYTKENPDTWKE